MRVTGGSLRGRNIEAPEGLGTRPTSDRVREALFNLLHHHDWGEGILENGPESCVALDAFAGSGTLGIEALSRGARQCIFFEKDRKPFTTLKENIARLGLSAQSELIARDVLSPPPARAKADLLFLDPPYRKGLIAPSVEALAGQGWLASACLIVAETALDEPSPPIPEAELLLQRPYGSTVLSFFKRVISV